MVYIQFLLNEKLNSTFFQTKYFQINITGRLGLGKDQTKSNQPTKLESLSKIIKIVCSDYFNAAIYYCKKKKKS